jgi:phosphoserine phosphatase
MAVHGNKVYLRGLAADALSAAVHGQRFSRAIELFPAAVQRVWWHAMRGDCIVLASGTLEPLAEKVKFALEREMLWCGIDVNVAVLATRLEIREGRLTGRVRGAPIFGEAKARAIREFTELHGIMLSQCSAYGDSSLDRWMLAAVGHPVAVNADADLKKIASMRGWPAVSWMADRGNAREVRAAITGWKAADWKRKSETAR